MKLLTITITCETCKTVLASESGPATEDGFRNALWKCERVVKDSNGVMNERFRRQTLYYCQPCSDGRPPELREAGVVPFPNPK